MDTGIARTCHATLESTRYRGELNFHQAKISKLSSKTYSQLSNKYLSTSDLVFEESITFKCFLNPIILIAVTSITLESSLSIDPLGFWHWACAAALALLLPPLDFEYKIYKNPPKQPLLFLPYQQPFTSHTKYQNSTQDTLTYIENQELTLHTKSDSYYQSSPNTFQICFSCNQPFFSTNNYLFQAPIQLCHELT